LVSCPTTTVNQKIGNYSLFPLASDHFELLGLLFSCPDMEPQKGILFESCTVAFENDNEATFRMIYHKAGHLDIIELVMEAIKHRNIKWIKIFSDFTNFSKELKLCVNQDYDSPARPPCHFVRIVAQACRHIIPTKKIDRYIFFAIEVNDYMTLRILLSGVDTENLDIRGLGYNQDDSSLLPLYEMASQLTNHFDILNELRCENSMPSLFRACHREVLDATEIQELLNNPLVDVNESYFGHTPCHLAITRKNAELLSLLLQCPRTDPNIPNRYHATPLYCSLRHSATLEVLLQTERVDVNIPNKNGVMPFVWFCCYNGDEFDEKLLNLFLNTPLSKQGTQTSDQVSVIWNCPNKLVLLLDDPRFDPTVLRPDDDLPFLFHCVSSCDNYPIEVVQKLLADERIDVNFEYKPKKNGKFQHNSTSGTILDYACENFDFFLEIIHCPRLEIFPEDKFNSIVYEMFNKLKNNPECEERFLDCLFGICQYSGISPLELIPNKSLASKLENRILISRSKQVI